MTTCPPHHVPGPGGCYDEKNLQRVKLEDPGVSGLPEACPDHHLGVGCSCRKRAQAPLFPPTTAATAEEEAIALSGPTTTDCTAIATAIAFGANLTLPAQCSTPSGVPSGVAPAVGGAAIPAYVTDNSWPGQPTAVIVSPQLAKNGNGLAVIQWITPTQPAVLAVYQAGDLISSSYWSPYKNADGSWGILSNGAYVLFSSSTPLKDPATVSWLYQRLASGQYVTLQLHAPSGGPSYTGDPNNGSVILLGDSDPTLFVVPTAYAFLAPNAPVNILHQGGLAPPIAKAPPPKACPPGLQNVNGRCLLISSPTNKIGGSQNAPTGVTSGVGNPSGPYDTFHASAWNFDECTYTIQYGDSPAYEVARFYGIPAVNGNPMYDINIMQPGSQDPAIYWQLGSTIQMPLIACNVARHMAGLPPIQTACPVRSGQVHQNGTCVAPSPNQCPPGTRNIGGRCVAISSPLNKIQGSHNVPGNPLAGVGDSFLPLVESGLPDGAFVWDGGFSGGGYYEGGPLPSGADGWDPRLTPWGMGDGFPVPQSFLIPSGDLPGWKDGVPIWDDIVHPATDPTWIGNPASQKLRRNLAMPSFTPQVTNNNNNETHCVFKGCTTLCNGVGKDKYCETSCKYDCTGAMPTGRYQSGKDPLSAPLPVGLQGLEAGIGTVYQPATVASTLQTYLNNSGLSLPALPPWGTSTPAQGDWTAMVSNAAAGIYSALNPGAGPPATIDGNALSVLQNYVNAAGNLLQQYGPGGGSQPGTTTPAIPGISSLNPLLASLSAYFASIIPGILANPPSGLPPLPLPPSGVDATQYIQGLANMAAALYGTLIPNASTLPNPGQAWDLLSAGSQILSQYLPGATPLTSPPLPPPNVTDCGIPGWHYDAGQGKCVGDPVPPPQIHIGPSGCPAGSVSDGNGGCAPAPVGPTPPPVTQIQCANGTIVSDLSQCPKPAAPAAGSTAGGGSSSTLLWGSLAVLAALGIGIAVATSNGPAPRGSKKA